MPADSYTVHSPVGIGGWLLVYCLWAGVGIVFAVGESVYELFQIAQQPVLLVSQGTTALLAIAWYALYGAALYRLVRQQHGAVARIKMMIIGTAIFGAIIPGMFSALLALTIPDAKLWPIVHAAYSLQTLSSLGGAMAMAVIWYRYFCVSKRVMNTWPEERTDRPR